MVAEEDTGAVANGGFEAPGAAASPWRFETRDDDGFRDVERPYRGAAAARLCGEAACDDRLSQAFAPPPTEDGTLLLRFRLQIQTVKPSGGGCDDNLIIRVAVGEAEPDEIGRVCEEAAAEGFGEERLNVTPAARRAARAGEALRLTFAARTDDEAASTTFWLDDVALLREDRPPGPANVRVSEGTFSAYSEPHVAVDPSDRDRLVGAAKFFTGNAAYRFRVGTFASDDGGRTWRERGLLPELDDYDLVSDPVVAFGPGGAAYVVVIGVPARPGSLPRASGWGVFAYRSTDGGQTFAGPLVVDIGRADDKPWLAVDRSDGPARGTIYVVWADGPQTYLSRSVGGAHPFSPRQRVLDTSGPGAQVAVGPDGELYVLAPAAVPAEAPFDLLLTISRDGGATFDAPRPVIRVSAMPYLLTGGTRAAALPQLAVAPDSGDLLVAWNDARDRAADVWLSRSTDGGATFSAPHRVNDVAAGDQFQPTLVAGEDGALVVGWFDRRADPANRLADVYVARSADGGATFGRAVRLSTQRFDPALAAPRDLGGALFFGDYQGLALAGDAVVPFWNDPRSGLQQIYAVRVSIGGLPTGEVEEA